MPSTKLISNLMIILVMINTIVGCKKEEPAPLPEVTTTGVSDIAYTTAKSGGTIIKDGGSSVTARGVCWSTNASPTIKDDKTIDGLGAGSFNSSITGLIPSTAYFIRAYAISANGTAYGISFSFTTSTSTPPQLTTSNIINAIGDKATGGGTVTSDGGAVVTVRGVCWSSSQNPTIANSKIISGSGLGSFTGNLTGLTPGTTYYVKAFATNSVSTTYGNMVSFVSSNSTFSTGPTDSDGNIYNAVTIGTQIWTVENLRASKYADGTSIPNITSGIQWVVLTTGAWSTYNNDPQFNSPYGKLYNWYAVTDSRKLCPSGWHVPSQPEFAILVNYIGGNPGAAGKMKEAGLDHWQSPNTAASNNSGFTGLPGGVRGNGATYFNLNVSGIWWTSTPDFGVNAKNIILSSNSGDIIIDNASSDKQGGMSVRCVKD